MTKIIKEGGASSMKRISKIFLAILAVIAISVPLVGKEAYVATSNIVKQILYPDAVSAVVKTAKSSGWEPDMYSLDEKVNKDLDESYPGNAVFSDEHIYSVDQAVTFMNSGTDAVKAIIERATKELDCTEAEIKDKVNWVLFQPNVDYHYNFMTYWKDGAIHQEKGRREGKAGDIMIIFISPKTKKFMCLRGACGNPVFFFPIPNSVEDTTGEESTTIPESTTTPESTTQPETTTAPTTNSDSKSGTNRQPGDGTEVDAGTGTKPKATTASPIADSTAAKVESSTKSNSGIWDWILNPTGSETGGDAVGATTFPAGTTRYIPPTEPGVNPTTTKPVETTKPPVKLEKYYAALAAVSAEVYTPESWATYQTVVNANRMTDANTQAQIDTATANIVAAQKNLVVRSAYGTGGSNYGDPGGF